MSDYTMAVTIDQPPTDCEAAAVVADAVGCPDIWELIKNEHRVDPDHFLDEFDRLVRHRLFELALKVAVAVTAATEDRPQVDDAAGIIAAGDPEAVAQPPPERLAVRALTAAPAAPPLALAG